MIYKWVKYILPLIVHENVWISQITNRAWHISLIFISSVIKYSSVLLLKYNWNGFKNNNGLWSGKLQFHLQLDLFIVSPHTPPPTSFSTPSFPYPNPQPHNFNRTFVGLQSSSTEPVSCWLGRFWRPRKMFPWARLTFTNIETTGASIAKSLRSPRGSSYGRGREECFSPHCGQVCGPEISLVLDNV